MPELPDAYAAAFNAAYESRPTAKPAKPNWVSHLDPVNAPKGTSDAL